MWKKRIILTLWFVLGAATMVLLVAAMHKKEENLVSDIKVEIEGAEEHVFVDEKDVVSFLNKMGINKGTVLNKIDSHYLEEGLKQNAWIKNADLFFDNNNVLRVNIQEREPFARIFTMSGNSFYIDSSGKRLPLSDNQSARVPVFTSFPSDNKKLSGPDSTILAEVKYIAAAIREDSFFLQQVSQVDITPQHTYEMIPVLGNQVIAIGDTSNLQDKFNRLYSFYKQVWPKAGFEKYERIDVQYNGQVVATRRGAAKPMSDSASAMMRLTGTIEKMGTMISDSSIADITKMKPAVDSAAKTTLTNLPVVRNIVPKAVMAKPKHVVAKKNTAVKPKQNAKNKKQAKALMRKKH